jgi:hypothetical protein
VKPYYKKGTYNAACGLCGFVFKADELVESGAFPGVYVCKKDYEPRNILDFFKVKPDTSQTVAWSQDDPEATEGYASITVSDSPYTLTSDIRQLVVTAVGGNVTISLPLASTYSAPDTFLAITRTDTGSNTVTIQRQGSDIVVSGTSITLAGARTIRLINDGVSRWNYF